LIFSYIWSLKVNIKIEVPFFLGANPDLFEKARGLRAEETFAEELLWQKLRNRKFEGFKFRRQHPLLHFIADFYCHELMLVVEIDGSCHSETNRKERDTERTRMLNEFGIHVIRFTNDEVEASISNVLTKLKSFIQKQTHRTLTQTP